jgi:Protein of unknown function (DUF4058)
MGRLPHGPLAERVAAETWSWREGILMYSRHMSRRFPGVDPYIEDPAFWRDFRRSFMVYCADAVYDRLPDAYDARINVRFGIPDAAVQENRLLLLDGDRLSYLEILHRPTQQLVTTMELLSPSNKVEPGYR